MDQKRTGEAEEAGMGDAGRGPRRWPTWAKWVGKRRGVGHSRIAGGGLLLAVGLSMAAFATGGGFAGGFGPSDPVALGQNSSAGVSPAPGLLARKELRSSTPEGMLHDGLPPGAPVPQWVAGRRVHIEPSSRVVSAYARESATKQAPASGVSQPLVGALGNGKEPAGTITGNEEASNLPPLLRYLEGTGVVHAPVVHLILWGSNFETTKEGLEVEEMLSKLYGGLSNSPYQGILTQYFDSSGRVSPEATVVTPTYIDKSVTAPSLVNGQGVEQELAKAIAAEKWPTERNDIFVVVTAPRSTYEAGFPGGCAYHSVAPGGAIYALVPYQGDPPFSTEGCIFTGNPDGNAIHKTSKSASHEYAEAATDPFLDTWITTGGAEIADVCSEENDLELPDGAWVQNEYDDHLNACTHEDLKPPHVYAVTGVASKIGKREATVAATVNAEGEQKVGYRFEYGTTTQYGQSIPASNAPLEATHKNQQVQQTLSGLTTNTTYHYRVVVTNEGEGTKAKAYGGDQVVTPSNWSSTTFANPNRLTGVSCSSSKACLAVGNEIAETWNGIQWTEHPMRYPGQDIKGLRGPVDVAADSKGNIWVTEAGNHRVDEFSPSGELLRQVGGEGTGPGQFKFPFGVAVAPSGNIWVTDQENNRVEEFSPAGTYITQFGTNGSGEGQFGGPGPRGIAVDAAEHLWVVDTGNNRVEEFQPEGTTVKYIRQVGTGGSGAGQFNDPEGITTDSGRNVWVVDNHNSRVQEFSPEGGFLLTFGWGVQDGKAELETCTTGCQAGIVGSNTSQFNEPKGITVDEKGNLWVIDNQNGSRGQEFKPEGTGLKYITQFGSGAEFTYYAWGVAAAGGSIYVADTGLNLVESFMTGSEGSTPTFTTTSSLSGVSCTSATACTAVGSYTLSTGVVLPLAERWDGLAWQPQSVPAGSEAKETALRGVSCFSSTECMAVGYRKNSSNVLLPYAALWRNGTWTVQSTPESPGAPITLLDGVSCTSATACMATGQIGVDFEPGPESTLAERWDGTKWSIAPTVEPSGADKGELFAVSCAAANSCTAVGDARIGRWFTLAERWDGTKWSLQSTPSPTESTVEELNGVSCANAESCTAVGSWEGGLGRFRPTLVEQWNGVGWTIAHETPDSLLLGASCAQRSNCAVVGVSYASGFMEGLAETGF